jgi:integrase
MPDFRLQRFRDGWAIAVYEGGKRLSRRGLDARDASAASAEFERIVAELKRPVDPDVATIWAAYREDRAGRRIALNMDFSGRAILPFFGRMKPESISVKACREYVAMRRKIGRNNGTIGTELNHLRIALKWAHKGRMIAHIPAIEMPPKPPAKERYLTRAEASALLDASETPHLRLFIVLAISTAARAGALFDLTWDRVDFDRGLIYLGAMLALRPRKGRATVPMTDQCRAALSEARHGALTGFVIEWGGSPVKSVRTALAKAARRAGVDGVSPHVLRHTAAVWMSESGVPMGEIAAYLGHADSSITERIYAKFSPTYLRGASGALTI